MSQITEPTKIVLDSAARGIMAAAAIAFVWALLFTIGVMTGWFAPWWLWIGLAVIIFMAVANMPDEPAKKQEGADEPPTEPPTDPPRRSRRDDIRTQLRDVERHYCELTGCPLVPVDGAEPPTEPGVYAFFIEDHHPCYVGRTGNLRQRIQQHKNGAGLAGHLPATIVKHDGVSIDEARQRVRAMKVRWIVVPEEDDHGVRQALLELYAAVELPTLATTGRRYSTFRNH